MKGELYENLLMKQSHNSKMNSTFYQFWNAQHSRRLLTNSTRRLSGPLRKLLQPQQKQLLADTKKTDMMKT